MAAGLRDCKPHASLDEFVEDLGVAHRAQRARYHLMLMGSAAVDALRRGLHHADPKVRVGCCIILDHHLDSSCVPDLIDNLTHHDPEVRAWAAHALACDKCKEGACRPGEDEVIPLAIEMLRTDQHHFVRERLIGVLGPAVHHRADVMDVLVEAHQRDSHPTVRKLAGWWIPGGPRFERTRPRQRRQERAVVSAITAR
ncbi:MAG TPA: HEAT repeat domain-containing protein [Acidimicrobiales bacterium]|nr:HEAT repeat domain-containing protein [Acidimicrobiales bacterium]